MKITRSQLRKIINEALSYPEPPDVVGLVGNDFVRDEENEETHDEHEEDATYKEHEEDEWDRFWRVS